MFLCVLLAGACSDESALAPDVVNGCTPLTTLCIVDNLFVCQVDGTVTFVEACGAGMCVIDACKVDDTPQVPDAGTPDAQVAPQDVQEPVDTVTPQEDATDEPTDMGPSPDHGTDWVPDLIEPDDVPAQTDPGQEPDPEDVEEEPDWGGQLPFGPGPCTDTPEVKAKWQDQKAFQKMIGCGDGCFSNFPDQAKFEGCIVDCMTPMVGAGCGQCVADWFWCIDWTCEEGPGYKEGSKQNKDCVKNTCDPGFYDCGGVPLDVQ